MSALVRLSFSLEAPLARQLEELTAAGGYENRSEFLRDLIREKLVRQDWESDAVVVGTITMVYDHHQRLLTEKLTDLQHDHHDLILASTHVHLDHHLCAEVIIARGKASALEQMTDALRRQKGIFHASLTRSATHAFAHQHRH